MKIDQQKSAFLVRVAVLHKSAPTVLSAFELETLWALTERALDYDIEAETTAEEWAVVEQAHAALEDAHRRVFDPFKNTMHNCAVAMAQAGQRVHLDIARLVYR